MDSKPFEWNGRKFTTYSEIVDYALKLKGKQQKLFTEAYCNSSKYASQNIGYISGYYDAKTAKKIMKIFSTEHPIFGTKR
jgi:hypothetical protein